MDLYSNLFTFSVQGRSGLVKQHDFRIPDEGSCNSYALLLTSGQLSTLLAHSRIITLWDKVLYY